MKVNFHQCIRNESEKTDKVIDKYNTKMSHSIMVVTRL